jgi:hypothetical protein
MNRLPIAGCRQSSICNSQICNAVIVMNPSEYCREVEAYLCRKNEGHLVRIVGPAFETVCGWAEMGVPLKVAFRGIDQYCERYYAKGPRRRPVRIEHCEADILDQFDHWRRAVGVPAAAVLEDRDAEAADEPRRRSEGLPRHLDRLLVRLSGVRAGWPLPDELGVAVDRLIDAIDARRRDARGARGEARAALLAWLEEQDRALVAAARRATDPSALDALRQEAVDELRPFQARMSPGAWAGAVETALDRLVRERTGLPRLALD